MTLKKETVQKALVFFLGHLRLWFKNQMESHHGSSWPNYFETQLPDMERQKWHDAKLSVSNVVNALHYDCIIAFFENDRRMGLQFLGSNFNGFVRKLKNLQAYEAALRTWADFDQSLAEEQIAVLCELGRSMDMVRFLSNLDDLLGWGGTTVPLEPIDNREELDRSSAKRIVEQELNLRLGSNYNISNINDTGLWSVEPNFSRKTNGFYLLLVNNESRLIHVFRFSALNPIFDKFYKRNDKDVYRLLFNVSDSNFVETLNQININSFKIGVARY